jgi:hypothetical protein
MCLIVDANSAARLLVNDAAVLRWLLGSSGSPRLVAAGKLREELVRLESVRRILLQLDRAGRLRTVAPAALTDQERRLKANVFCKSNDHHVLALAVVSGARTLATLDNALTQDFHNPRVINNPRGKVFQDPTKHAHLLCHTPSCGVSARPERRTRP